MVNTVRTPAALLTASADNTTGNYTNQSLRDLIVSVPKIATPYNASNFGAFGDGSTHPASSVYGSLAALQAVYGTTISGVTVALTQELDWLATQAAINAAANAGGIVYSSGSFVYTNSNSVSDGSGTLQFPAATFSPLGPGVSWQGVFSNSTHSWPNDLGNGKFAILCGGRTSSQSPGFFSGLNLIGPGCGSTLGSTTCNMQGIGTNDRRSIFHTNVSGFKVGINIVGGQSVHEDNYLSANYYGMYWDTGNSGNFGNMQFIRVVCDGSLRSAIAVHHAQVIANTVFLSCFFGTSPYSIFKETNSGSPGTAQVVAGGVFDSCQFENFGNACVCDDTAAPVNRLAQIYNTRFKNCQWMWDTYISINRHITGVAAYAVFDIAIMDVFEIDGIWQPEQLQPGTVAIFSVNFYAIGVKIRGNIAQVLANCVAAVSPKTNQFFVFPTGGGNVIENTSGYPWLGVIAYNAVMTSGPVGSVLVQQPTSGIEQIQLSAGVASEAVLGVMFYNPNPAASGNECVYLTSGYVSVNVTGTVAIGDVLRAYAGGTAIKSTGTAGPVIGVAMTASSAGACIVKLGIANNGVIPDVQTTRIVTASGAITHLSTDNVIIVNKTTPATTSVALMTVPPTGQTVKIKDGAGNALSFPITVTASGNNIILGTDLTTWTLQNVTLSGTDILHETATTTSHIAYQSLARTAGVLTYQFSVDVTAALTRNFTYIIITDVTQTNFVYVIADVNGVTFNTAATASGFTSPSSTISTVSGKTRIGIQFTTDASTTGLIVQLSIEATAGTLSYLGVVTDGMQFDNISLTPSAGTIDDSATNVMNTNYASRQFIFNGTNWNVI